MTKCHQKVNNLKKNRRRKLSYKYSNSKLTAVNADPFVKVVLFPFAILVGPFLIGSEFQIADGDLIGRAATASPATFELAPQPTHSNDVHFIWSAMFLVVILKERKTASPKTLEFVR